MAKDTDTPKINDLIFKELIKRGYSLEGNTRIWNIADSKLWYLTPEQAQSYIDLENSEEYDKATKDKEVTKIIIDCAKEILEWADGEPINIVDLGCGDGTLSVQISELLPNGKVVGIDASQGMIDTALLKAKKNLSFLHFLIKYSH